MADITQEVNIDMLEKLANGNYKIKYPKTKAEQVVYGDGSTAVYHSSYAVASGTNSYTVNIPGITSLIEGMSVKIKFTNANTGASTLNINGLGAIPIKKSNGNDLSAGNIKAGQIWHLVYTGSVFQLLGEGGEYGNVTPDDVIKGVTFGTEEGLKTGTLELTGDAAASQVLTGRTFYTTNPKSKQTGTMPNRGAVTHTITTQGGSYTIPAGYHNGSGKVTANFANLIASNIRDGVTVGGVRGTYAPQFVRSLQFSVTPSSSYSLTIPDGIQKEDVLIISTVYSSTKAGAGIWVYAYSTSSHKVFGGPGDATITVEGNEVIITVIDIPRIFEFVHLKMPYGYGV